MRNEKKRYPSRQNTKQSYRKEDISHLSGENVPIRFIPEQQLGTGGLCEVYSARDLLRLEYDDGFPHVAVKRLRTAYEQNPAAHRLLAREFFIARNISHPGVVRVFDLHEEKGRLCLSMELLTGRNLYAMLGQSPSGLGTAAIPLARQLFRTLALLHEQGVAHGDIKPANLMLEKGNRLVLFDFNTAEIIPKPGHASSPISQSLRSSLGLAAYSILHASPERFEGSPPSFADDIFAACCTLIELFEGIHPFARHTALEARNSQMPKPRLTIGNTPEGKMLLRGISFNPALRPPAHELEAVFQPKNFAVRCFFSLYTSLTAKES